MKRIVILLICIMMICVNGSFAEEILEETHCLQDFIDSKLFADPLGCLHYDPLNGSYPAATYEEITKVFPGAVHRYYERAPEIRRILYRIPREIGELSDYWSNSKLLYSYWRAIDGVFVVIWKGSRSVSDVGLIAGRAFCFSSLSELVPFQPETWIPQEQKVVMYHRNIIRKGHVYLGNNTMDVLIEDIIPQQIYCLVYSEEHGFDLKSYLFWKSKRLPVLDCSFLIESEIQTLIEYINEVEFR